MPFSYGSSGEVWRNIDFIDDENFFEDYLPEHSIPILDGVRLRLLSLGVNNSNLEDFISKYGNSPFEVSLGEKSENECSIVGVRYNLFENVLKISRKICVSSGVEGIENGFFEQELALGKSRFENLPNGSLFEILEYLR